MRQNAKTRFARHLRREPTDAERRLWYHLRDRRLDGFKFRRQHPLGPYVVDFVCIQARLVVELDGGQHADAAGDATRTTCLQGYGYRVLRFWNNEALKQTEEVLQRIVLALDGPGPHPDPLPQAGEGDTHEDGTP